MTNTNDLHKIAKQMVAPKKGILAADESNSTAGKRLADVGVENTAENRRRYRDLFLNAEGVGEYLSGVILFTETLEQKSDDGVLFPKLLKEKGVLPGVKVDLGKHELPGFPNELVTQGLDGLAERLERYAKAGAQFTKWRSVVMISEDTPTPEVMHINALNLARYAAQVQAHGMVPIVEPEVLYGGGDADHSFKTAAKVTERVLSEVCYQMERLRVDMEGVIIKSSMVLPGKESGETVSDEEVARETARVLTSAIPEEVPGVVFLSGGQEPDEATHHLNSIAELEPLPFELAFSYGRAIQGPVLEKWAGKDENVPVAREELIKRLKMNVSADQGILEN